MDREELIFGLDIGTRTVIGVAGKMQGEKFNIIDAEIMEHSGRAMFDGQIHDISEVSKIVSNVTEALEKRLSVKFSSAAIAAAGRALVTKQIRVTRNIDPSIEIDMDTVLNLEMEGIQEAQKLIDMDFSLKDGTNCYCVGHSVINYYINDYIMTSLVGHKGKSIGADIIATFLPHTVIDSLYSVMQRVGLQVKSLTLEPIAAINAAIPKELRLINLALVDIGAGTSDIAITRGGSIAAYSMVPVAGDEITEMLCHNFLVDFKTAEKIKLSIGKMDIIEFTDILGIHQSINFDKVIEVIEPVVKNLADTIASKIIEYNKKSPNAVFLIGGGSKIDKISDFIAKNLNLPKERVAIRNREAIPNVIGHTDGFSGPETITPIGIALTAVKAKDMNLFNVMVNGKKVRIFNLGNHIAADALIMAGVKPETLIGKKGRDLKFTLNSEAKTVYGGYGTASKIIINGEEESLKAPIKPGDKITVKEAVEGEAASITVKEIRGYFGKEYIAFVNDKIAEDEYIIKEGDNVKISINDKKTDDALVDERKYIRVYVNGKEIIITDDREEHIFIDIFNYIDIDVKAGNGNIITKLNGEKAAFTDKIKNNDMIEIYFTKH